MSESRSDVNAAHDAVRRVLDRVGLSTYLFAVAPEGRGWAIEVEHPVAGAWRTARLTAGRDELLCALGDPSARARLARRWAGSLGDRDAA